MQRRTLIKSIAGLLAVDGLKLDVGSNEAVGVVDCHIHLFDPERKGGVPWPDRSDTVLYRPALPARYQQIVEPHHVVGAIAVECSPWVADNDWRAKVVESSPIMVGFVGNLLPDSPEFGTDLDRLHRSPFFLGIRYGNLWGRDLNSAARNDAFVKGLKNLSAHGVVLETANQDAALIEAAVMISDRVHDLRIVVDHLPNASIPADAKARAQVDANLRELAQRPQVYVKGSEIVHPVAGRVPLEVSAYRDTLDRIWDLFGEDRILYGSDWPNSDTVATYAQVFSVATEYLKGRSRSARTKYFRTNSRGVYRWRPRTPEQSG